MNHIEQFVAAMRAAGVNVNDAITPDGKINRVHAEGDRPRSKNAWYVLHLDGVPAGAFGNWKEDIQATWCAKADHEFTPAERAVHMRRMDEIKRQREAELEALRAEARIKAARILAESEPASPDHPYLARKGIKPNGVKQSRGALVIPAYSAEGTLQTLQFIDAEGNKRFLSNGLKKGCYYPMRNPAEQYDSIVVVEGFATAASIHEATGQPCAVAFDAGNLKPVAEAIKTRRPEIQIELRADNDNLQNCRECGGRFDVNEYPEVCPECGCFHRRHNVGLEAAASAAQAVGGTMVAPPDGGDFNDMAQAQGLEAVAAIAANDNNDPIDLFAEFPVPPIRREMLPAAIADYAFDQGQLVGVEPAMIAIPSLVACAAALHDGVQIQVKRHETGWRESARLWCAVVGSPSIKKSPSIRRAVSRLRKINADLADDNQKTLAKHASEMEAFKDAKKEAKKTGEHVTAPEAPQLARLVVEDTTVEALSEVLKDNARGVLCIQDELSGWFGAMDAYSGGKTGGKDRAYWLEAYNGGAKTVDRVMRGSINIPNWSVSMIGGIQPDAIRRLVGTMAEDGLMQRFMMIVGSNAPEFDRPEDGPAHDGYRAMVDHLYHIQPGATPVTLTEEAHQIREALNQYVDEMMTYGALPNGLVAHLGKWSGLFARLLLLFHTIECSAAQVHPSTKPVAGDTAARVDALMRKFLLPHSVAYYTDILGAFTELEHARWIAGHILSKSLDVLTNRDLIAAYKQWRGVDDWKRQKVMQVLEDMGWIVPIGDARTSKRGSHTWAVSRRVHTKFAAKAKDEAAKRDEVRTRIAEMRSAYNRTT